MAVLICLHPTTCIDPMHTTAAIAGSEHCFEATRSGVSIMHKMSDTFTIIRMNTAQQIRNCQNRSILLFETKYLW